MKCYKYLVILNGQAVARYTALSFAYARKRKIQNMWWYNEDEDEIKIYDTVRGIFV